jgi:SM-20-related protein
MEMGSTSIIDFYALQATPISAEPYPYLVVQDFLRKDLSGDMLQDFPKINFGGSFPLAELKFGPTFAQLIDELQSQQLRSVIEKKFSIDLEGRPILITARGRTRHKDGRIHTDTKSKLVTLLLYFNISWDVQEGRLRILRNGTDLENFAAEVPPTFGTCLIFKVTDNCWHGHKPFEGERRALQLNYLTDNAALKQHESKHKMTAKFKRIKRWFSQGDEY